MGREAGLHLALDGAGDDVAGLHPSAPAGAGKRGAAEGPARHGRETLGHHRAGFKIRCLITLSGGGLALTLLGAREEGEDVVVEDLGLFEVGRVAGAGQLK